MSPAAPSLPRRAAKRARKAVYEVDIAQDIREVRTEIKALSVKLDAFVNTFQGQLEKLNDNMTKALSALADHEARLTKLEFDAEKAQTKHDVVAQIWKDVKAVAQWLFKAGIALAALGGIGWAMKLAGIVFGN